MFPYFCLKKKSIEQNSHFLLSEYYIPSYKLKIVRFLRIEHDIAHTNLACNVIGQIEFVVKGSMAIRTSVDGRFGVFDNHMPIDRLRKLSNHIAQFTLIQFFAMFVVSFANVFVGRRLIKLSQARRFWRMIILIYTWNR